MYVDIQTARLCARAFTRPTITALARGMAPVTVLDFLSFATGLSRANNVSDLFDAAFRIIERDYRNEYFFKTEIANRIVFGRHSPRTCALSVELPVGNSIVDLAIFNGTSTAYEIKTELDTPRRLTTQTPDYLKVFDRVFIVTTPELGEFYVNLCDARVGVLTLNRRGSLSTIRDSMTNLDRIDIHALYRILRRSEYQAALESYFGNPIIFPNGLIAKRCEELFQTLPKEVAHSFFLSALRSRTTTESMTAFVSSLPKSLRVLGYATPMSAPQQQRFQSCLSEGFQLRN